MKIKPPRTFVKAITGTLATFAASIGMAMGDGDLTRSETIAAVGLGLGAGAAVYLSPKNADS